jgi:hypothetical protein
MDQKKEIDQIYETDASRYNFFLKIHKSIITPGFYTAVANFAPKTIILFVIQMCLLTALISGGAYTYYSLNDKTGLPAVLPDILPGMSINKGTLDPARPTPYVPEKTYVAKGLNILFCLPGVFDALPDSFVVVDTSALVNKKVSKAQLLLTSRNFEINTGNGAYLKLPYSKIFPGSDTIVFSRQGIKKILGKNIVSVYINFFIQSGIINTGTICLSIIFLTLASYIFRIEKKEKIGIYFKMACCAVSPVFIGLNLLAVSGAQFPDFWYILVVISVIIMFRGIQSGRKQTLNID